MVIHTAALRRASLVADAETIPRIFISTIWRNTTLALAGSARVVQRVRGWSKNKSCHRSMHDQEFIRMAESATGADRGVYSSVNLVQSRRVWGVLHAAIAATAN
jgi:hypothetical protein